MTTWNSITSLKGEFEAEGLSRLDVASEALFAARHGLEYLVKISGAEAKSDLFYLADLGIKSIVCPMVETAFAMEKYMQMLSTFHFEHVAVTIETVTAVANLESILDAGAALTEVTIGRTDLTASFKGEGVESERTMDMVKLVARAARNRNLKVTMGGSISKHTRDRFNEDPDLLEVLDFVETRKVVMSVESFTDEASLSHALEIEALLLRRRARYAERTLSGIDARLSALTRRA